MKDNEVKEKGMNDLKKKGGGVKGEGQRRVKVGGKGGVKKGRGGEEGRRGERSRGEGKEE